MSNNFCLLDSKKFNENLQAVNLGKTLQNTILIDSNNNLLQNNTVNEQANNIQYINKKNQNIINPQINNNQDIQKCYLNNSLYAIYNNGNEKIKYIKDEKNNDIYDIDMNNETEFSFQEKLKEIEKNIQQIKNNNINPDVNLIDINQNRQYQSQALSCDYSLSENNGTEIINNNTGDVILNLEGNNNKKETKVYSKTGYGNRFFRTNFNINNFNLNKQNQKNIISKRAEISNEDKNRQYLSKLNEIPITESHVESNMNNNNNNDEVLNNNNNNPIIDIPTVKSNYN